MMTMLVSVGIAFQAGCNNRGKKEEERTLSTASNTPSTHVSSDNNGQKDEERILGTWVMVSGEKEGKKAPMDDTFRLSFARDGTFKIKQKGPDSALNGVYTINSTTTPKEIDLTVQGKKWLGIYVFEKDNLELCLGEIEKKRPTEFVAPAGERLTMLMILQRGDK
jgi:uncharacterized protein (TIGR03067 family)